MPLRLTFFRCASCAACDQQAAILEHVKREAPGEVEFRELRTDRDQDEATRYRILSHPVLVLERGSVELRRWNGVTNKLDILAAIREFLGPLPPAVGPTEVPSGPATGMLPGKATVQPPSSMPPPSEPGPEPPGEPPHPPA